MESAHPSNATVVRLAEKAADLGRELKARVTARPATREATIELDPPDLGRVRMQIHVDMADRMKATLDAASSKAADLLAHHAGELKTALAQAGIQFDRFTSSGTERQFDGRGFSAQTGGERGGQPNTGGQGQQAPSGSGAADPAADPRAARRAAFGRSGRLDVVV